VSLELPECVAQAKTSLNSRATRLGKADASKVGFAHHTAEAAGLV
jgi:hypothetical protein